MDMNFSEECSDNFGELIALILAIIIAISWFPYLLFKNTLKEER